MSCAKPIGYYVEPADRPLLFHVLDVGEGLMVLLVFPDETTMLCDCNVTNDNEDQVLRYLAIHVPTRLDPETERERRWIDVFVNSHRDQDHIRGLKRVSEVFPIRSVWDSGQTGANTQNPDYQYYMRLRRSLTEKYGSTASRVPVPGFSPVASFGGALIYCLNSREDFLAKNGMIRLEEARSQHTNAIVLSIRYADRSILLTADSDWRAWRERIVPNFEKSALLRSNVLVASHHGSRSFFTDEQNGPIDPEENPCTTYIDSIDHIAPSITLISCGLHREAHHPNEEALAIYREKTANEQVYTTNDKGTVAGFIGSDGQWTVAPSRCAPRSAAGQCDFEIACTKTANGSSASALSGSWFEVGCEVLFSIRGTGGILDPASSVSVWWEVSNGGHFGDHEHQEIYYKGKDGTEGMLQFRRTVSFHGTHLLRCRVRNKSKGKDITRVFVVNAI